MGNQIMALSPDHFVVAPDSRGHGLSTDTPSALHYDDMAADMIGLMDHLHIAKVDIVGWSDGGIIALDMAMRHPDRVRSLTPACCSIWRQRSCERRTSGTYSGPSPIARRVILVSPWVEPYTCGG